MAKHTRIALIFILALAIVLSCTVAGHKLTDPATYAHTIEVLDRNRSTVLGLSAAAAAASSAISALPDDTCSPIAEEIAELTTCFLLILGVLYLEKYLLTILGAAACYLLIPAGCAALLVTCFFPTGTLRRTGIKLLAFAAALLLVIPGSVWISDQVDAIYSGSIEATIQSADAASGNLLDEVAGESEESTTVIDEAKTILSGLSGSVGNVAEQFKHLLNRFMEATAVLIVTTCLIPVLVILFFAWVVKALFNVQVVIHAQPGKKLLNSSAAN